MTGWLSDSRRRRLRVVVTGKARRQTQRKKSKTISMKMGIQKDSDSVIWVPSNGYQHCYHGKGGLGIGCRVRRTTR